MPKKIAIIGGGVTGLSAAFELEKTTSAEIHLYDAERRLGGKVGSIHERGFLIEGGPDCFFSRKAGVMDLIHQLELESELIEPQHKEFSIFLQEKLHPIPSGLISLTSIDPAAVDRATILSPAGKARVKEELCQPRGNGADESIRTFFTRRFGAEFTSVVAEPLLAGTHGGDPSLLSMRALYPSYLDLEQRFGSISGGSVAPTSGPTFLSFRKGMQTLIDGLEKALRRTHVHVGQKIETVNALEADRVLLAIPSNHASRLVQDEYPAASAWMKSIKHRSSAIVTAMYDGAAFEHQLSGTGFLVPEGQGVEITGATWSSSKWMNRAPSDKVLLRIFMGGDRSVLSTSSDRELSSKALVDFSRIMRIEAEPAETRVTRWLDALPQYEIETPLRPSHVDLVEAIHSDFAKTGTVFVSGTSYDGVGVPDCLRQGREAAKRILESL